MPAAVSGGPENELANETENESVAIARHLADSLDSLHFPTPSHVYNPTRYAWGAQHQYLGRFGGRLGRVLLLGMNPGPWGMAQTGVPFGEVGIVRDWLKIEAALAPPFPEQHPKYPIRGFSCHRSEGSGKRFWGWAAGHYPEAPRFFERFFVWNYCPLLFIGNDHNMVPGQLKKAEREPLFRACDEALRQLVAATKPVALVGIGRFAEWRAKEAAGGRIPVFYLHHPSPANPAANRDWGGMADETLKEWL